MVVSDKIRPRGMRLWGWQLGAGEAESKRLLRSVLGDACCDLPPPGGTYPEWLDWPEGFRVLRESVRWADARRGLLNKDVAMEGPLLHELADIADFILANRARQRHAFYASDIKVELAAAGLTIDVNLTDRVAWELNRLDWENKNKERHKDDVIFRLALLLFCFHLILEFDPFREQLLTHSTPCVSLTWELVSPSPFRRAPSTDGPWHMQVAYCKCVYGRVDAVRVTLHHVHCLSYRWQVSVEAKDDVDSKLEMFPCSGKILAFPYMDFH